MMEGWCGGSYEYWSEEANKIETAEEKARRLKVPFIPARKPPTRTYDPNPTIAVCGVCGIEVKREMYHACSKDNCPITRKVVL